MQKIALLFLLVFVKAEAQTSAFTTADSLFALGNYNKAINLYKQQQPETAYGLSKIGQAYNQLSAHHKAIPFFEKSIQKDSTLLITQYELARLYTKTRAFTKADSLFKKLIVKDNTNPNFHYQLGRVQMINKNGNYIASFKKAVAVDAYHLKSIKQLCKQFLKQKKWGLFDQYLNLGLQEYPENETLINYKAQGYFNRKQYEKAIPFFLKLYESSPKNKFVLFRLGLANHGLKNYTKALSFYELALKEDSKNGDYHLQMGKLYYDTNDMKNAAFQTMLATYYNKVALDKEWFQMGLIHKNKKDYKKAIGSFKKALKEQKKNYNAQFELAVCTDNYYKDDNVKLKQYNLYFWNFEGKNKRYDQIVAARISYFKTQLHLESK